MARRSADEFQFTVVELLVLAAAFLLSCTFVFFLGIYVGREAASQHAPLDERVARVPAPDPSAKPSPTLNESRPVAPATPPLPARQERGATGSPPVTPPAGAVIPYTVQVMATRNRAEAEQVRVQLLAKRIGAFVSEVEEGGGRWYRVRIGRYDDMAAARGMEERVRRELGLTNARVVPAAAENR